MRAILIGLQGGTNYKKFKGKLQRVISLPTSHSNIPELSAKIGILTAEEKDAAPQTEAVHDTVIEQEPTPAEEPTASEKQPEPQPAPTSAPPQTNAMPQAGDMVYVPASAIWNVKAPARSPAVKPCTKTATRSE